MTGGPHVQEYSHPNPRKGQPVLVPKAPMPAQAMLILLIMTLAAAVLH